MAIKCGNYEKVLLRNSSIEELSPFVGEYGLLIVYPNNHLVFQTNQERKHLWVTMSLGDFFVPSSNELWVKCDNGEATFCRSYSNPLWELEKS